MKKIQTMIYIALLMALTSCGEDRSGEFYELIEDKLWIEQGMREYYLWYEDIPAIDNENDYFKEPAAFFKSLLSKDAMNGKGDIYSYLEEIPAVEAPESRTVNWTSTYGLEFNLYNDPTGTTNHSFARVIYVLPDSPAYQVGIQRGDWISTINHERITTSNAENLVKGGAIELTRNHLARQGNKLVWQSMDTLQVNASVPMDFKPVLFCASYELMGKTTAYMVYNKFETSAENDPEDTAYSDQLKELFTNLRSVHPDEFILDLRYNPGGYDICAQTLLSLLIPAEHMGKTLFYEQFNKKRDPQTRTFVAQSELEPYNLNLKRIYILTGPSTASASELVINALIPYMGKENVILLGTPTVGKNVGMNNIKNETFGLSLWPVTSQVFNANGESDYSNGFAPHYPLDERNEINWLPLGNPQEYMLSHTLSLIYQDIMPQSNASKSGFTHSAEMPKPKINVFIHN